MSFKKLFKLSALALLIGVLVLNFLAITPASNGDISLNGLISAANAFWPEGPVDPGSIGSMKSCTLDLGGGWFTASVEWICEDQYVCPSCSCTPIACGQM